MWFKNSDCQDRGKRRINSPTMEFKLQDRDKNPQVLEPEISVGKRGLYSLQQCKCSRHTVGTSNFKKVQMNYNWLNSEFQVELRKPASANSGEQSRRLPPSQPPVSVGMAMPPPHTYAHMCARKHMQTWIYTTNTEKENPQVLSMASDSKYGGLRKIPSGLGITLPWEETNHHLES